MQHFLAAFFFSPVGIISSRICYSIVPDTQQGGYFLLEMPQEGPGIGLLLHSPEWSVATANKNCLCVILFYVLRLQKI